LGVFKSISNANNLAKARIVCVRAQLFIREQARRFVDSLRRRLAIQLLLTHVFDFFGEMLHRSHRVADEGVARAVHLEKESLVRNKANPTPPRFDFEDSLVKITHGL
jgi:hypothetical protein